MQKKKQNLRDLWNIINHTDIYIEGVTEGEEKEKGAERIVEETMTQNYPNFMGNINLHIQESQQTPSEINSGRFTLRHIIVKLLKSNNKEHLEGSKRKCVITYTEEPQ